MSGLALSPRTTSQGVSAYEVETKDTELGRALYTKLWAPAYRLLSWREVWDAFDELYPGRWAVEVFPPRSELVDGKAVYHLFVLDHEPVGMNVRRQA